MPYSRTELNALELHYRPEESRQARPWQPVSSSSRHASPPGETTVRTSRSGSHREHQDIYAIPSTPGGWVSPPSSRASSRARPSNSRSSRTFSPKRAYTSSSRPSTSARPSSTRSPRARSPTKAYAERLRQLQEETDRRASELLEYLNTLKSLRLPVKSENRLQFDLILQKTERARKRFNAAKIALARERGDEQWETMERDERMRVAMRDHFQEKVEELDRILRS